MRLPSFARPALLALALAACRVVPASPDAADDRASQGTGAVSGDTLRLAIGQGASVPGTPVTASFVAVPVDSRCPVRSLVQCVWAGDAQVALRLTAGSERQDVVLHTGIDPRRATIAGHVVELVGLEPERAIDDSLQPGEYRALLRGWAGEPEPPVAGALGDTVRIPISRLASFDGGRLTVAFAAKLAESRCPANAMCVHQGDAEALLRLEAGSAAKEVTLHTNAEPQGASIGAYRVKLVGIDPYPGTELPNVRMMPVAVVIVTRQ